MNKGNAREVEFKDLGLLAKIMEAALSNIVEDSMKKALNQFTKNKQISALGDMPICVTNKFAAHVLNISYPTVSKYLKKGILIRHEEFGGITLESILKIKDTSKYKRVNPYPSRD